MQLKSLSINGFKSFAKPIQIVFSPGVTAVVGPNGCGKSNVVDAMRWVLGEQRSNVLRSGRMDNVIFNGTIHRKPLGLAEAKLVLDNSKGLFELPYSEIEIARRLYRDGTSEYLLNGTQCRLKDIADLLHDSGMGPNPYTILELKMIEEILREDGEGRKTLFEEAAGVAKYKLRRRQALQKLAQTEEDLLRLADIITEIERQVSSLKRQVARARRYEELTKEFKTLEAALLYKEYVRLKDQINPLEAAKKTTTVSTEAVRSAMRLEEAKLEDLRTSSIGVEKEASAFRKELEEVVSQISVLQAENAGLRARDVSARQTIERTKRERILYNEKKNLLIDRQKQSTIDREAVNEELRVLEEKLAHANKIYGDAESTLQEIETRVREHDQFVAELRNKLSSAEKQQNQITALRAALLARKEMRQNEIAGIHEERNTAQSELIAIKSKLESANREFEVLQLEEAKQNEYLQALLAELSSLEEKHRALLSQNEALHSKLDLLATLEEKGPRSSKAIKNLREHPVRGLKDLLGDAIEIEEEYRQAMQAVLGPVAYYYLTENDSAAFSAIDQLRTTNSGQTTFISAETFTQTDLSPVNPPAGVLKLASDLLGENIKNPVLNHYLSRVAFVTNWDSVKKLRAWSKESGYTLVTLDGQWLTPNGVMRGGSEETKTAVDLGLTRQISNINDQLAENKKLQNTISVSLQSAKEKRKTTEQNISELKNKNSQIVKSQLSIRELEVKHRTLLDSLEKREQIATEQVLLLDQKISEADNQTEIASAEVEQAKQSLVKGESSGGDFAEKANEARVSVSKKRDNKHDAEKNRDSAKHRLELIEADLNRIAVTLTEIEEELVIVEQNSELAASEIIELEVKVKENDSMLMEKFRLRDQRAQTVDKVSVKLDEVRTNIRDQEDRLKKLRENQDEEASSERRIEIEIARLQGELDALLSRAKQEYNFDLSDTSFVEAHPYVQSTETSSDMVFELKQRIERLGPVNLLAIEEYEQENARLDAMLKNRDDLLNAKRTLEETISKINETAQAKFLHTFELVRENFQKLFREFFGSGEADLILSGTDPLDADITMWANPSGKRLKSISLMSGGEKTMIAIALLFSLYQVKPSPFCILDEVDAPLDDANIDRFNRMIRKHSNETQFILITHNKRTMETADNLYGVTMEEEGVSKLVSVKLLSDVAA